MRLKVLLPNQTLIDREVEEVVAESVHGSFCLKPRHVDYAAPLVAGILAYTVDGRETFLGTSEGVLVKAGAEVLVSVRDAVSDADLGSLRDAVVRRQRERRTQEDEAREAANKLELAMIRRFIELEEDGERRP